MERLDDDPGQGREDRRTAGEPPAGDPDDVLFALSLEEVGAGAAAHRAQEAGGADAPASSGAHFVEGTFASPAGSLDVPAVSDEVQADGALFPEDDAAPLRSDVDAGSWGVPGSDVDVESEGVPALERGFGHGADADRDAGATPAQQDDAGLGSDPEAGAGSGSDPEAVPDATDELEPVDGWEAGDGSRRAASSTSPSHVAAAGEALRAWSARHRLAAGVIGWCLVVAVVIAAFALAINLTLKSASDNIEQGGPTAGYVAPVEDAELPHLALHFVALDDAAFPHIALDLRLSPPAGQEMPVLAASDFKLSEHDAEERSQERAVGDFSFDPASGACRIGFDTDAAALGAERTVVVALDKASDYRGKCSVTYRVPGM